MRKDDCIFCKIVAGEIPSHQVYEDEDFLGLLDIFPSHRAQILVIPKEHHTSNFAETDSEVLKQLVATGQTIAQKLHQKFSDLNRVQIVIEGFEVDHLHLKLYPAFSEEDAITSSGERAGDEELARLKEMLK